LVAAVRSCRAPRARSAQRPTRPLSAPQARSSRASTETHHNKPTPAGIPRSNGETLGGPRSRQRHQPGPACLELGGGASTLRVGRSQSND
jgi:hypothetical protein